MKFSVLVLGYDVDKWILKHIDNSGEFIDKIYFVYSKYPWSIYNKNAREQFSNKFDLNLLKQSKYYDKIEIIEGVWDSDEGQRNAGLAKAKEDGMDYLIIQDADEFYTYEDFKKIITDVTANPNYDYYTTPWVSFWKTFDYIIVNQKDEIIIGYPEVVVNLNRDNKFIRCRRPSGKSIYRLNSLCYHASYVLTDAEVWSKIHTWGHAHQFNAKRWYDEVWKKWDLNSTNLHPVKPTEWKQAIPYDINKLPEVLKK